MRKHQCSPRAQIYLIKIATGFGLLALLQVISQKGGPFQLEKHHARDT